LKGFAGVVLRSGDETWRYKFCFGTILVYESVCILLKGKVVPVFN